MLNHLWASMVTLAAAVAAVRVFWFGETAVVSQMTEALFTSAKTGFELAFGLVAALALWLGLIEIAKAAGLLRLVARGVAPLSARLMPEVPADHPAHASVGLNVAMSMLGLDDAALPAGLKAMSELEQLNPHPGTATRAQQMFMAYMTASVTLLPVSILAFRAQTGSLHPADVLVPTLLASSTGLMACLLYMALAQRLRWRDPVLLGCAALWLGGVGGVAWAAGRLPTEQIAPAAALAGNGVLLLAVTACVVGGWVRRVPVYEAFVEGASQGFKLAVQLIPYVLAMLMAVGLLRASGVFALLQGAAESAATAFGFDTRWVTTLPQMAMKPFSGGGARALMLDTFKTHGPDSFAGHLAAMLQGACDTMFYCLAVCAGAARLRQLGHAVPGALVAWASSCAAALVFAYLFFGG